MSGGQGGLQYMIVMVVHVRRPSNLAQIKHKVSQLDYQLTIQIVKNILSIEEQSVPNITTVFSSISRISIFSVKYLVMVT